MVQPHQKCQEELLGAQTALYLLIQDQDAANLCCDFYYTNCAQEVERHITELINPSCGANNGAQLKRSESSNTSYSSTQLLHLPMDNP